LTAGAYAVVVFLALVGATMAGLAVVRPPVPARIEGYRGPIRFLGYWAFWVSGPVLRIFAWLRLTADQVTFLGLALTALAGVAAGFAWWGPSFLLLVFGSWCDLLDGEVARSTGTMTKAGAFLDSNLDRLSEIVLFAGLAVAFPDRAGMLWAFGAVVASLMVSYTRARGEGLGVTCPNFGLERPHRVVLAMFAFLAATFTAPAVSIVILQVLCGIVALGAGVTAAGRMLVLHGLLRRGVAGAVAPRSPPTP
jgi:CDP-diacylglycerol--glycerol-3-phosphate 3-phosphatidyltransferase